MERKLWKEQEDKALKQLYQIRKIVKWSEIAQTMANQFQLYGRNGKQCRERYRNHLDTKINKRQWSEQEDALLFQLHNQLGNRWSKIAQSFQDRTDSAIKNHLYSVLRKGLKNINSIISNSFRKNFKLLKPQILYKIVEASQKHFNLVNSKKTQAKTQPLSSILFKNIENLKMEIYRFSTIQGEMSNQQIQKLKILIKNINSFSKRYRKKKRSSIKNQNSDDDDMQYQQAVADEVNKIQNKITKQQFFQINQMQQQYNPIQKQLAQNKTSKSNNASPGCQANQYLGFGIQDYSNFLSQEIQKNELKQIQEKPGQSIENIQRKLSLDQIENFFIMEDEKNQIFINEKQDNLKFIIDKYKDEYEENLFQQILKSRQTEENFGLI